MRVLSYLSFTLYLLAVPFPATAQEGRPQAIPPATTAADRSVGDEGVPLPQKPDPEQRLAELFGRLKREADPAKAEAMANEIRRTWQDSGSATVDLLTGWATQAAADKNMAAAYDFLDQAIVLDPDFAEAWNLRATLHFSESDYGLSIADVEQALAREPRHFGALMGLGMMLEEMGRNEKALETYERVLVIYPALKEAQDAVGRLSDELAGQPA